MVNKLQSKGYHVNLLKTETGWYRVAISQFAGFKQAELSLAKMKSKVNKRMLVLCTSYKQASELKNKLYPKFLKKDANLYVHERGRSKNSGRKVVNPGII